jgi:flagellar hook assembly protein FlgD
MKIKRFNRFTTASAFFVGACLVLAVPASASSQPSSAKRQKIQTVRISGSCTEHPDYSSRDVVLDEELNSSCRVKVTLNTKSPARVVELQYYDDEDGKWVTERKKKTSKGAATVAIPGKSCGDNGDVWCDGTYQYRIFISALKRPKQPALRSRAFDVIFISISGDDYYDDEYDY